MNTTLTAKIGYSMLVIVPYIILLAYAIYIYPKLPDDLSSDLPKVVLLFPLILAAILPVTYGVLVFRFGQYLRQVQYWMVAAFMDLGIFGLLIAFYLIYNNETS